MTVSYAVLAGWYNTKASWTFFWEFVFPVIAQILPRLHFKRATIQLNTLNESKDIDWRDISWNYFSIRLLWWQKTHSCFTKYMCIVAVSTIENTLLFGCLIITARSLCIVQFDWVVWNSVYKTIGFVRCVFMFPTPFAKIWVFTKKKNEIKLQIYTIIRPTSQYIFKCKYLSSHLIPSGPFFLKVVEPFPTGRLHAI